MPEDKTGLRRHLSYANVMVTLLLFVVLGGGAYATHTHRMGTQDLQNRAVAAPKIANGAVIPRTIRNNAVRPAKINDDAVRSRHIADGAINSDKVADNSLTGDDIDQSTLGQVPSAANADDANQLQGLSANALSTRTDFVDGQGSNPTATRQFLAPPATVSVAAGEAVHVTSHMAFGSTASGGASNLDLYICVQGGGPLTTVGAGAWGNRVAQNTRVTMGLSAIVTGLAAGSWQVGLCGQATLGAANWNSNDWGYTSAMVFRRAN